MSNLCYVMNQTNYNKIPGSPIAYWVSENIVKTFENKLMASIAFSDGQILTGDNEKYLRYLWEVDSEKINKDGDWVLHAKGGEQRRWYGNIDTVVSWTANSINHYKTDRISRFPQEYILFRTGVTWSLVSSSDMFSMRYLSPDTTFNKAAATILFKDDTLAEYTLGFLNSIVTRSILKIINPTLNTNIKDILSLPFVLSDEYRAEVEFITQTNIQISKADWDSFETSWDFKKHPLI